MHVTDPHHLPPSQWHGSALPDCPALPAPMLIFARLYSPLCLPGRGEPIRLALAALNIEWEECGVDYPLMKSDLQQFPFAQCPRWVPPGAEQSAEHGRPPTACRN